jgi:hypothetical protein
MLTDWYEFVMIAAHCLLTGFEVGARTVMEKRGCVAAAAGWIGTAEKTRMKAIEARSAPDAVSLTVENFTFIFRPISA